MSVLGDILREIQDVQSLANDTLEGVTIDTLRTRQGQKAQAVEALKRLRRQYVNELRHAAAWIVVVGDKRDEFVSLATEHCRCMSTDPNTYFSKLVDRVPSPTYLGRESVSNTFDILSRHIEDMAHELDIVGYPQLVFKEHYYQHVSSRQDFLRLVRLAVTEQIGGEIVGIQAAQSLADEAISKNNTASYTPVLLPIDDEKIAVAIANGLTRISGRVFLVVAGQASEGFRSPRAIKNTEPTQESVTKTLKKISTAIEKTLLKV